MEIPKRRHTLIGKALGPLPGAVAGFAAVCSHTGGFFLRLARELRRLERRAERIASGDRGEALEPEREDEVSEPAEALDAMAGALADREREVESARKRLFKDEKTLALGTLVAGMAHEIANPIHAILAICEQMKTSLAEDRGAEENLARLEMIVEQIDRIGQVIHELSDFAHPAPAQMEPTSVNLAIESAIRLLRLDRRFREIDVSTCLSRDVPMVNAVAGDLTHVAIHILRNAADAMEGRAGRIVVTSRREADRALIIVEDDGCGMSAQAIDRAVDPFFTTKSNGEGTGLGLAVCRSIIDRHGGSLEIESDADRGTTVRIGIPVPQEAEIR